MKLYVSEHLHLDTGTIYYAVIEDDNWKYPMHGRYTTKQAAEDKIKELNNEKS